MGQSSNNRPVTPGRRNPQSCNLEGSNQSSTEKKNSISVGASSSNNNTSTSHCSPENNGVRRDGQVLDDPNLREFTLAELRTATKNFRADTLLAEGGFRRVVYKGWIKEKTSKYRGDGLTIAVKKLQAESLQCVWQWQEEIDLLGRLSHPSIIKLLGFGQEDGELLLVYEFMPRGSLDNHLFGRGANVHPLSWDTRLKVMIGVARGLSFLHSLEEKIIHRDLQTSHILLDETYTVKLCGFGLAKYGPTTDLGHVSIGIIGTSGYADPEYIATGHLYVKSDVYGFGIVVMEMLTGKRIMDITMNLCRKKSLTVWVKSHLLNRGKMRSTMDAKLEGKYPSNLALQLAQLTLKCIQSRPNVRPSMKEVVETLEKIEAANEKLAHNRNHVTQ